MQHSDEPNKQPKGFVCSGRGIPPGCVQHDQGSHVRGVDHEVSRVCGSILFPNTFDPAPSFPQDGDGGERGQHSCHELLDGPGGAAERRFTEACGCGQRQQGRFHTGEEDALEHTKAYIEVRPSQSPLVQRCLLDGIDPTGARRECDPSSSHACRALVARAVMAWGRLIHRFGDIFCFRPRRRFARWGARRRWRRIQS